MKIDISHYNRQYYFADLAPGAVFSDESETNITADRIFIKLGDTEDDDDENAVSLENGKKYYFNSFDIVFPLSATLVI
jgi:hypothetical protein